MSEGRISWYNGDTLIMEVGVDTGITFGEEVKNNTAAQLAKDFIDILQQNFKHVDGQWRFVEGVTISEIVK